jgi:hypothetical protein
MADDGGGGGGGAAGDGQSAAVAEATAELRQMSTSCQNPDYGQLANFDIEQKVFEFNKTLGMRLREN